MDKISIEYIWFSEDHITIPKDIKKELDLLAKKEICNVNKKDLEKKSKNLGLSYEVYEVRIPEKI